jgi:hypothetical protein
MSPVTAPPTACPAIQEWHKIVREAPGIWCQQDHLFGAKGDWRRGDYLTIAIENQACAYWGVPRDQLDQDDPPVFLDRGNKRWVLESTTTSEFAVTWLASSIKWSRHNRAWANGVADVAPLRMAVENLPRLGLADWKWPAKVTRFYGTADLLVELHEDDDASWVWVSARDKAPFRKFVQLLAPAHVAWEASSDEWPDGWVSAAEDPD